MEKRGNLTVPGTLLACTLTGTVLGCSREASMDPAVTATSGQPGYSLLPAAGDQGTFLPGGGITLAGSGPGGLLALRGRLLEIYARDSGAEDSRSPELLKVISLKEVPQALSWLGGGGILTATGGRIDLIVPDTGEATPWADLGPGSYLTALVVHAGSVYAADSSRKMVYRFNTEGRLKNLITGPEGHFVVPSPFFDVAPGPGDTVWITNPGRHRVENFSPAGELLGFWGEASEGPSGFAGCCNPIGILALGDGSLLTREKGLQRIKHYSAAGELLGVIPGRFASRPEAPAFGLWKDRLFYLDGGRLRTLPWAGGAES